MPSHASHAVGALYDNLLQSALRQFFGRATFDTEAISPVLPDGRLAIEPSASPAALMVRWFGTRHTLRVSPRWPFTSHEVRLAQAIGAVLAARYAAIMDPRVIAERGDLFRGAIEDRYIGAFLDRKTYAIEAPEARADRIASLIEVLRVAALSSYENRPISTGVLLLNTMHDPCRPEAVPPASAPAYTESLATIKSFYRLADGVRTVFLVNADGRLLDIIDVERWGAQASKYQALQVPCAKAYQAHARATLQQEHVCVVLSPSREIKVFAEGAELFTFRSGAWHLLDLQAKYRLWAEAVGDPSLAMRIFQTALDLADARQGALFVVTRDATVAVNRLVAPGDRFDRLVDPESGAARQPSRGDLLHWLEGRSITDLDPNVFAALASLDGAVIADTKGKLLAAGAIVRHVAEEWEAGKYVEGARTTAALSASRYGPVLKVSEDGIITFFENERVWDI